MTLLRASSEALGEKAALNASVGAPVDDYGVAHGAELVAFAEAAVKSEDLDSARQALLAAVGPAAAGQAVATVAAFSGLVRVADGTGIPVDDGLADASGDIRADLGLGAFGGASNSPMAGTATTDMVDVDALWTNRR